MADLMLTRAIINAVTNYCGHFGDPLVCGVTVIAGVEVCSGCAPIICGVLAALDNGPLKAHDTQDDAE